MTTASEYTVSLLEDGAEIWAAVEPLLPSPSQAEPACVIGLVGWVGATREEISRLPQLRESHPGPLVAVVREPPGARGAHLRDRRCRINHINHRRCPLRRGRRSRSAQGRPS